MKIELNDRILWHDGTNQVDPGKVPELFLLGVPQDKIIVTLLNDDIEQFNQLADDPISMMKESNGPFDFSWNIPDNYKNLNLINFLSQKIYDRGLNYEYADRLVEELKEVEKRGLEMLFKTLIYVVDRLREEGKVWGVGRGSSCASLVLHLIGVHEVDPIKFGIPMTEFFHD